VSVVALEPGLSAALVHTVEEQDTAAAVGSGDVPVLATPRLLALCEAATVAALSQAGIPDSQTTVGTRVTLEHRRASAVGEALTVVATLVDVDGRRLVLDVAVSDDGDRVVGHATITRVLVDRARFLARP
jgi:fluoroacetyl-CoA thioesterase